MTDSAIVFHASTQKNLKIIEPKRTLSNNKYIGDYVFATANSVLATMYLTARGYATVMEAGNDEPYIIIRAELKEYLAHDKGGSIYELPADSFIASPQTTLLESEVVSTDSVIPIKETEYDTSLRAMGESRVLVYFASPTKFELALKMKNHKEIINHLTQFPKPKI